MSFRDLNIKLEYRTLIDSVAADFYIPLLCEAKTYKRAVGYFSSSILIQISKGLCSMASRNCKIQLIASPELSQEDYEAIKSGYTQREVVETKILNSLNENFSDNDRARLDLLAHLISDGSLDIKLAIITKENSGIFHEKVGIMTDYDGNTVAFSGSANETFSGFNKNYESIDVFCSWKSVESDVRCTMKEMAFNMLWENRANGVLILDFPEVIKEKLMSFKTGESSAYLDVDKVLIEKERRKQQAPSLPDDSTIHYMHYQEQAINKWLENKGRGIFDMATGTGKTFAGLGALTKLFQHKKRLIAIIVCPFVHLVDQWKDEAKNNFGIEAIAGYSDSSDWETKFKRAATNFELKRTDFFCVIMTNGSFSLARIQETININLCDTLLIVDEAHNFGAMKISSCLNVDYPYRLALSATINRYGDPEGTEKLFSFFGEKCIEYSLREAIENDFLTPYIYHPILVSLTTDELDEYTKLTIKIKQYNYIDKSAPMPLFLQKLLIKRARIVAGAKNKISLLQSHLKGFCDQGNMLIYCGAVKYGEIGYDEASDEKRQIDIVVKMIHDTYGIPVSKFTAEEDSTQRASIKKAFIEGNLKALVAIKCLDEGMNIPAIKTAFILASSTNPKEYIQRRGRVLRKFPGKQYAEIFDFITLSRPLEDIPYTLDAEKEIEKGLAIKELSRMLDFAELSKNPASSNDLKDRIVSAYKLDLIKEEEVYE